MAAITSVAIATVGTGLAAKSAHDQAKAGKNASRAQQAGYDASTAEQSRQFDLGRQDTLPFRQVGTAAINQLAQLYGLGPQVQQQQFQDQQSEQQAFEQSTSPVGDTDLPVNGRRIVPVGAGRYKVFYGDQEVGDLVPGGKNGRFIGNGTAIPSAAPASAPMGGNTFTQPGAPAQATAPGQPDYSAFYNSPDYAFARQEGTRGIERSAAARGGIASGNTLASLARFNSGLATQNYGNYVNRLSALAGIGQTSSEGLADRRNQFAINLGNNAIGAGGARASGIQQRAGAYAGFGNDLLGFSGYLSSLPKRNGYPGQLSGQEIDSIFAPRAG